MKMSNKLLLGFFLLVILVITAGMIILKIEFGKISYHNQKDKEYRIEENSILTQTKIDKFIAKDSCFS